MCATGTAHKLQMMNAFTLRRFEQDDLAMAVRTYGGDPVEQPQRRRTANRRERTGGCQLTGATNIELPAAGHFRIMADRHLQDEVTDAVLA